MHDSMFACMCAVILVVSFVTKTVVVTQQAEALEGLCLRFLGPCLVCCYE